MTCVSSCSGSYSYPTGFLHLPLRLLSRLLERSWTHKPFTARNIVAIGLKGMGMSSDAVKVAQQLFRKEQHRAGITFTCNNRGKAFQQAWNEIPTTTKERFLQAAGASLTSESQSDKGSESTFLDRWVRGDMPHCKEGSNQASGIESPEPVPTERAPSTSNSRRRRSKHGHSRSRSSGRGRSPVRRRRSRRSNSSPRRSSSTSSRSRSRGRSRSPLVHSRAAANAGCTTGSPNVDEIQSFVDAVMRRADGFAALMHCIEGALERQRTGERSVVDTNANLEPSRSGCTTPTGMPPDKDSAGADLALGDHGGASHTAGASTPSKHGSTVLPPQWDSWASCAATDNPGSSGGYDFAQDVAHGGGQDPSSSAQPAGRGSRVMPTTTVIAEEITSHGESAVAAAFGHLACPMPTMELYMTTWNNGAAGAAKSWHELGNSLRSNASAVVQLPGVAGEGSRDHHHVQDNSFRRKLRSQQKGGYPSKEAICSVARRHPKGNPMLLDDDPKSPQITDIKDGFQIRTSFGAVVNFYPETGTIFCGGSPGAGQNHGLACVRDWTDPNPEAVKKKNKKKNRRAPDKEPASAAHGGPNTFACAARAQMAATLPPHFDEQYADVQPSWSQGVWPAQFH